MFVSVKIPENTWGKEVEADKIVEIQIQYTHFPADSQLSRTPRAHSRTVRPPGPQRFGPVSVNLPVQHRQHRLTGLWLPLEPTPSCKLGMCSLPSCLLLCTLLPFLESRFILQDPPSHSESNSNTMEDEDTHDRIFNTELDGIIFLCRVTSAALRQLETIKIRIASSEMLEVPQSLSPPPQPRLLSHSSSSFVTPNSVGAQLRAAASFNSASDTLPKLPTPQQWLMFELQICYSCQL